MYIHLFQCLFHYISFIASFITSLSMPLSLHLFQCLFHCISFIVCTSDIGWQRDGSDTGGQKRGSETEASYESVPPCIRCTYISFMYIHCLFHYISFIVCTSDTGWQRERETAMNEMYVHERDVCTSDTGWQRLIGCLRFWPPFLTPCIRSISLYVHLIQGGGDS